MYILTVNGSVLKVHVHLNKNSSIFHLLQKSKESDVSREANFQEEIQTALNKIELLERELNILKKDKQVLASSM